MQRLRVAALHPVGKTLVGQAGERRSGRARPALHLVQGAPKIALGSEDETEAPDGANGSASKGRRGSRPSGLTSRSLPAAAAWDGWPRAGPYPRIATGCKRPRSHEVTKLS